MHPCLNNPHILSSSFLRSPVILPLRILPSSVPQPLSLSPHAIRSNIQTVRGEIGRWTITDATLSHDNRFLAYSSITPCVYFARTGSTSSLEVSPDAETWKDGLGPEENQTVLDFSGYNGTGRFPRYYSPNERDRMDPRTGIWSLRFSADGRELVAGASDQCLYGIVPGTLVFEPFLGVYLRMSLFVTHA